MDRRPRIRRDARPWQIGVLTSLLLYGVLVLDFALQPLGIAAVIGAALATQALCNRAAGQPFDPRSALISGLSLCLLLRSDAPLLLPLAAVLAVASKFLVRVRGKHVFNPTCLAIVVCLLVSDAAWVSTGQWGEAALSAFAFAGLGMLVVFRTSRSDVTWAFLAFWSALVLGRGVWLGDPPSVGLHALSSGALLLFAFFMISDPRTLPDTRAGRVLFAAAVCALGGVLRFGYFEPAAPLFALAACAPLVPLLDRLLPGERFTWNAPRPALPRAFVPQAFVHQRLLVAAHKETPMTIRRPRRSVTALGLVLGLALGFGLAWEAQAFCGFYVSKADAELFNKASQVVIAREGDRTVVTMASDFRGDPREFAMVVPVPTFLEKGQIHVGDPAAIAHLDAYTAPRLVEYHDPDPCNRNMPEAMEMSRVRSLGTMSQDAARKAARAEGVTIEARYDVGEYDILILSAEESDGLIRWLRKAGYRIPDGAEPVVRSYLKQDMRFFVAKVDLEEHARSGYSRLRPLQVAFESPKFMLPIRLGTVNGDGPQELFVYALSRKGRVETTNYRTVKLPTGVEVPTYVKGEFAQFYKALFSRQVERHAMRAVFLEYAWDMGWCDPCAADPLSLEELRGLGAFWVGQAPRRGGPKGQARDAFVTRLHVRYDAAHFPADLQFQETGDRSNFQGRYVLRHAFAGEATCAADAYWNGVHQRQEREARTLADLTGWDLASIRHRSGLDLPWVHPKRWWETLWN